MKGQGESDELYDGFIRDLRQCAGVDGFRVFERTGRAQVLELKGPKRASLNVRTDAQKHEWWGFTKNIETTLNEERLKWFLVLLGGTPDQGYLLSDFEVLSAKAHWSDAVQQYHIHPHHLRDSWKFRGIEQVWGRIKNRV